jgi:predicted ATPase
MANPIRRIHIQNFRSLENITLDLDLLNVLFGPNGVGKSTFLDTIWFVRDCAIRGVDSASSDRDHGIGILWNEADPNAHIIIRLETDTFEYTVEFGFSSGRIEPFVGEKLFSKEKQIVLIERVPGSDKADFYHSNMNDTAVVKLRQPEKLALTQYLYFQDTSQEAADADRLFRFVHSYQTRSTDIFGLKRKGSEAGTETWLRDRAQNLWSVLRNLKDKRGLDDRYDTIMDFMRQSFPNFDDVLLESMSTNSVYGSFIEKNRKHPIKASGVSDGHLQLLIHLTCLFSEGRNRDSIIIFDEPETSLHPHAISVFAEAVKNATVEWNKQIMIATHSPVLLSQFPAKSILAGEMDEQGRTTLRRVSDIENIQDLLESYSTGSLYMAEVLAPQSHRSEAK